MALDEIIRIVTLYLHCSMFMLIALLNVRCFAVLECFVYNFVSVIGVNRPKGAVLVLLFYITL